jgi:polysaccharide deacetylase 2 family uncharacterized protein YibQ
LKRKQSKRRDGKLTLKERFCALFIAGLCMAIFSALFFARRNAGPPESAASIPVNKAATAADAAVPSEKPASLVDKTARAVTIDETTAPIVAVAVLPEKPAPPIPKTAAAGPVEERPLPEPEWNVVCVIDDAGNNLHELEPFLRFPGPFTIAVLPGLPYSAKAARMIREAGKEVILHQPMEAIGGADPGPGAIYTGMSAEEVRSILEKNAAEIGPIAGINNHQGSKVTEDEAIMKTVLEFCRENELYFLDSRTTAATSVPKVAAEMGSAILERNIFLDNEQDSNSIEGYLEQGLNIARKKKTAVLIGHIWSPELAGILSRRYTGLNAAGYTFFTVSEAMRNRGG